ncbi:MAG: hypothetical protein NWR72_16095 [Bacteroidia bacterium]|nr:hypothetical protein [Bacteroidia bacterium]
MKSQTASLYHLPPILDFSGNCRTLINKHLDHVQDGRILHIASHTGPGTTLSLNLYGRYLRGLPGLHLDILQVPVSVREWRLTHLESLAQQTAIGGKVILVSELFNSKEVPELAVWSEQMPSSLLRHCMASGKALPGSNPTAILRDVERSESLLQMLGAGFWSDTWTWEDEMGELHLMYSLTWSRVASELKMVA